MLPVQLHHANEVHCFSGLEDSGSAIKLDPRPADGGVEICATQLKITAINNLPFGDGFINHYTIPATLKISLFHIEELVLFIIKPYYPGIPLAPSTQTSDFMAG